VAFLRRRGEFVVQTVRRLGQSACGVFVGITKATTAQVKEVCLALFCDPATLI
jgi:hypothetical protein